jgi:hypothetical protein
VARCLLNRNLTPSSGLAGPAEPDGGFRDAPEQSGDALVATDVARELQGLREQGTGTRRAGLMMQFVPPEIRERLRRVPRMAQRARQRQHLLPAGARHAVLSIDLVRKCAPLQDHCELAAVAELAVQPLGLSEQHPALGTSHSALAPSLPALLGRSTLRWKLDDTTVGSLMTPQSAAQTLLPPDPAPSAPSAGGPDLRAVAGDLIRDIIRRDPALWARVRVDQTLRREFGFDDDNESL